MGTNFYLETDVCPHCGTSKGRLHIGKSGAGWCFALHVEPERGISNLVDRRLLWSQPNSRIIDEHGVEYGIGAIEAEITQRGRSEPVPEGFGYAMNAAEPGPDNLIRHQINGRCIGHGAGPWDLIVGEFSLMADLYALGQPAGLEAFKAWLVMRGCEVLPVTNEWDRHRSWRIPGHGERAPRRSRDAATAVADREGRMTPVRCGNGPELVADKQLLADAQACLVHGE